MVDILERRGENEHLLKDFNMPNKVTVTSLKQICKVKHFPHCESMKIGIQGNQNNLLHVLFGKTL